MVATLDFQTPQSTVEGGDVMLPAAAPAAEEAEQQDRDLEN